MQSKMKFVPSWLSDDNVFSIDGSQAHKPQQRDLISQETCEYTRMSYAMNNDMSEIFSGI